MLMGLYLNDELLLDYQQKIVVDEDYYSLLVLINLY
jgi:hypothetical protein